MTRALTKFPDLKWIGFDIDGVMTDGGIIINDQGSESKRFNSRDGHGVKMLIRSGLRVAIVTGRRSDVVELRAREIGITEVHQKVQDKLVLYKEILASSDLRPEETAFAGDDIVDLPVLVRCGLAMCPADAVPEVLDVAHFVSRSAGGHGAAREMVEYILKGLGFWPDIMAGYLEK